MAIKVPNVGELEILEIVRSNLLNAVNVSVGLFKSDVTPAGSDVLADYTAIEADFDGYAGQAAGAFVVGVIVGGKAFTSAAPIVWTPTGSVTPNDIYGFFVYDDDSNTLLWAGRFSAAPIAVTGPLTPVVYTPSFTLASES